MYWLRRPPYTRWIVAGLLVCCGLYLDLRPTAAVRYPFAATAIEVGERIDTGVTWREVPAGILPEWPNPVAGIAVTDIAPGTPVVPSLAGEVPIPAGWWAVSLPLPHHVAHGTRVRIVLDGGVVEGVMAGAVSDTGFELSGPVAFPAADAARVAAAAADSAIVVMIGRPEPMAGSSG